ncbi:MAG: ROK family protein [Anaerolineaceae bacterium]|nr:ROK family protein [Anaerolineaceae bacterium]
MALDFGGTKLAAAVVELESGQMASPVIRLATPAEQGAQSSLQAMIAAGNEALAGINDPSQVKAVGISFGGPVSGDRRTVLCSNHVSQWDNFPLADTVAEAFKRPAVMENDANAAALGHWWYGDRHQAQDYLYVQVSTGVGAGIVLGGELYRGGALAGEFGHTIIDPQGPKCSCGRYGCLESLCSGWAIARDGREILQKDPAGNPILAGQCGGNVRQVSAQMVFEACRQGEEASAKVVERALFSLGIALVNAISLLDPQKVALGGGITRSSDMLERYLYPVLKKWIQPFFEDRYQLDISTLEGQETLLGAALLARDL